MDEKGQILINLLSDKKNEILDAWMREQLESETLREDLMSPEDLQKNSAEFLEEFVNVTQSGNTRDIATPEYKSVNEMLSARRHAREIDLEADEVLKLETATSGLCVD